MDNKRKNVYITIFVITTIIAGCLAVYFGIDANQKKKELEAKSAELQNSASNETSEISEDSKTNVEIKEVEKIVEKYGVLNVDTTNCLNKKDDTILYSKHYGIGQTSYGVIASLSGDYKTITVNVDLDKFKHFYGNVTDATGTKNETHTFNKKVETMCIGGFGQSVQGETIFCIMEDGTVEYLNLNNAAKNNNFADFKQVSGVSNIIAIQTVNVRATVDSNGGPGWVTSIAFNKDGNFYDLGNILDDVM